MKFGIYSTSLLGTGLLALAACDQMDSPQAPVDEPVAQAALTTGPLPGKIAFTSSVGGAMDIYAMNADGSGVTRLTSFDGQESTPAWSWDNTRIAMIRTRPVAGNPIHSDIFVINADGSNGHWASPEANAEDLHDPAWSPDGSRILVRTKSGLKSLSVATGTLTDFMNGQQIANGFHPSFDPSGQKVIAGDANKVVVYRADGTGLISSTATPHGGNVEFPTFSPDGSKILFLEATSASHSRNLYLLSGATLTLLSSHGIGAGVSWAPDGKQIVFAGLRGDLYRANADATHRVDLAGSDGGDAFPAYTH